jgi:hypothetical protein
MGEAGWTYSYRLVTRGMMINQIITITFSVALLAIGIICLVRSREMQQKLIKSMDEGKGFHPFPKYVRSEGYLRVTKIIGVCCLFMGGFLIVMLLIGNIR